MKAEKFYKNLFDRKPREQMKEEKWDSEIN
jgi:hypothetical protein